MMRSMRKNVLRKSRERKRVEKRMNMGSSDCGLDGIGVEV
jgi:hypothetical protein